MQVLKNPNIMVNVPDCSKKYVSCLPGRSHPVLHSSSQELREKIVNCTFEPGLTAFVQAAEPG